ncbi:hypothetical protein P3T35_006191 [Kitasatospora sp. GP30]|uniref:hypothetical protein n=1 Tax=Kitasatospora sp. GP30 TaxID=3035084 RepID=UPI000CBA8221|nr:hypothetical protein [Kitasatospora sp. GP30]MDH6144154.1 hypothetical protein [Kitasatospora sp. GP30]
MNTLPALLASGAALAGITRTVQTIAVLTLTAVSVLARKPQRRRDARRALALLLRRRF